MAWKGVLPDYVRWLHNSAINAHAADEYTRGHIAGFLIKEEDIMMCDQLEGIKMVYLVYKERGNADPVSL